MSLCDEQTAPFVESDARRIRDQRVRGEDLDFETGDDLKMIQSVIRFAVRRDVRRLICLRGRSGVDLTETDCR